MNQEEIDAHGVVYPFQVTPGDGRYMDVNGDGIINANDRTIVGDAEPDFMWSFGNRIHYRNFDLNIQIDGSVGGKIFNYHRFRSIFNHEGRNYFAAMTNRWRSEEDPG